MPHYGVMYSAADTFTASVGGTFDFITFHGATAALAIIHEVRISQRGTADAGDAQAEMIDIRCRRWTGIVGSGGTLPTAASLLPGAPAAAYSVQMGDTTVATGPYTDLLVDAYNVQAGWLYLPTPDARIFVPAVTSEGVSFTSPTAFDDTLDLEISVVWEEIPV